MDQKKPANMPRIPKLATLIISLLIYLLWPSSSSNSTSPLWFKGLKSPQCEEYTSYATRKHPPFSHGSLQLPFMRPPEPCRTFKSKPIDDLISQYKDKMKDADLYRIFENSFPNTLDTTILWFDSNPSNPRTFISTGDIHAEWLRDSARQLSVYQRFISEDESLQLLIKGAILQQAEYIGISPYCNAFQPPLKSKIPRIPSSIDNVQPYPDWKNVFECKWELDSLASFLTLTNEYLENSMDFALFENKEFIDALVIIQRILNRQAVATYDKNGNLNPFNYSFKRKTDVGSETLPLQGTGNPVNDIGLIRSAFRPSDDACIYQFLIPSNIHLLIELKKIIPKIKKHGDPLIMSDSLSARLTKHAKAIENALINHAIVKHPVFGEVYAYEIDGFGSYNLMDDANIPSLLSLPDMGYCSINDQIYQNTRTMILSKLGNPYFLTGKYLKGIGGPHVGLTHAWPMSLLMQIRTSDDDDEITELLEMVKETTAGLGLMHEGVHVNSKGGEIYTRPWFSWCNSEFGKTILDLAERKPWLIFKDVED